MCNAGPQHLARPKVGMCKRLKMQDMMDFVTSNDLDSLYKLYQAPHWIAWYDLNYGGNPEGIFSAACPPEALHALENGIFLHLLKELFHQIMSRKSSGMLDNHVGTWNTLPGQHYVRSHHIDGYPRLLFTNGISSMSDLKADDWVGIVFCIIIACLQVEGKKIYYLMLKLIMKYGKISSMFLR